MKYVVKIREKGRPVSFEKSDSTSDLQIRLILYNKGHLVTLYGMRAGSSPHRGIHFLIDFHQYLLPVPIQHHEENWKLRRVADSG